MAIKVEIPMLIVRNHAAVFAKHAVFVIPFFPNPKPAGKPRHLIQELAKLNIYKQIDILKRL